MHNFASLQKQMAKLPAKLRTFHLMDKLKEKLATLWWLWAAKCQVQTQCH